MYSTYFGRDIIFLIKSRSFKLSVVRYNKNNKALKVSHYNIPIAVLKHLLNALLTVTFICGSFAILVNEVHLVQGLILTFQLVFFIHCIKRSWHT